MTYVLICLNNAIHAVRVRSCWAIWAGFGFRAGALLDFDSTRNISSYCTSIDVHNNNWNTCLVRHSQTMHSMHADIYMHEDSLQCVVQVHICHSMINACERELCGFDVVWVRCESAGFQLTITTDVHTNWYYSRMSIVYKTDYGLVNLPAAAAK